MVERSTKWLCGIYARKILKAGATSDEIEESIEAVRVTSYGVTKGSVVRVRKFCDPPSKPSSLHGMWKTKVNEDQTPNNGQNK